MFALCNLILKILPISWGRMRYSSDFILYLIDINSDTDSAAGRGTYLSCHGFFLPGELWKPTDCFLLWFYQMRWRIETGSSCAASQPHTECNVTKYGVITFFSILNISSLAPLHWAELHTTVWCSSAVGSDNSTHFRTGQTWIGDSLSTAGLWESDAIISIPSNQSRSPSPKLDYLSICRASTEVKYYFMNETCGWNWQSK